MISLKLKARGQRPIALDVGHSSIKMIQLAVNGGHMKVLAADKVRIDGDVNASDEKRREFVVSAIKKMLAGGNFRGRNVISCLSNDRVKVTSVRLAETEAEKIEEALKRGISQRFGLDADKDVINYMVAGDVRRGDEVKNELILFAADDETIKSHIAMLEEAGLRPISIDTVPCALYRGFERSLRRQADKERTVVFVDVGSRFTTVVFGRGGQICFVKQIPIGGDKFNREIAAKLGVGVDEAEMLRGKLKKPKTANGEKIPDSAGADMAEQDDVDASARQVMVDAIGIVAEELAREIALCLRYYTVTFRGKRVEKAVFAGGEAYENVLLNALKRQLAVEIEIGQPLRGFDMVNVNFDSDRRGLLCEWAVAVGLGLKGYTGNGGNGDYERN